MALSLVAGVALLTAACDTAPLPPPPYPPESPYPYPPENPPGQPFPPGQPYPPGPGQPYPQPGQPYPPVGAPYPPGSAVRPVAGTQWRVHAVNGRDTPPGDFFMQFEPDRFSVKFNCNGLGAAYVQRGWTIDPGVLVGTEMACNDMSFERQGSAVLGRNLQMDWRDPRRLLLSNNAGTIELRR